jgi:glucose/arabinose dehydrogenase
MTLPAGIGVSGMAFYRGTLVPAFAGDLFVAGEDGRALLRLRFDERDATRLVSTERLLEDINSPIRAVATGPDGVVLVATDRALMWLGPR